MLTKMSRSVSNMTTFFTQKYNFFLHKNPLKVKKDEKLVMFLDIQILTNFYFMENSFKTHKMTNSWFFFAAKDSGFLIELTIL